MSLAHAYVEAASAVREKIELRDQIRRLLNDVRPGDLVVCDKVDRWSRDPEFTYASVRQIMERGARFYAVGDACDPSTSEGDTMLNFRVLFAREEHKRIKQRLVGTRKVLRDRGYYVEGLPPFGYRRQDVGGERRVERNVLLVEADEAAKIVRAFRRCVSGRSLQQIADELDLRRDLVHDVVRNRIYIGQIENTRGEWITGKHAAIVDVALFQRAQDALAGRRHAGARYRDAVVETSDWALRDVAVCAICDGKMSSAYAGDKGARRYYYRCRKACTRRYVPVRLVEAAAAPMVLARLVELREDIAREPARIAPVPTTSIDAKLATLRARRGRLVDALAKGAITVDELSERTAVIDRETLRLEAQKASLVRPDALESPALRRSMLREVAAVERVWKAANGKGRRQIVNLLAFAVRLEASKEPVPVWRSASELAEEVRP